MGADESEDIWIHPCRIREWVNCEKIWKNVGFDLNIDLVNFSANLGIKLSGWMGYEEKLHLDLNKYHDQIVIEIMLLIWTIIIINLVNIWIHFPPHYF